MKLVISSGHGLYVRGASGYLDEVDEARRVVEQVATVLRSDGNTVTTYHDDVSHSQNENLNRIVNFHNSKTRDWDVSIHFNAYQTTPNPMGSEVLYVSSTGQTMARAVVDKIASNGFINRGPKKRTDLAFLNGTTMPAVLIETCFVDSKADADLYNAKFDAVCHSIAEGLVGHEISGGEVPPEPEPSPIPGEEAIAAIAMKSEIARYYWKNRGVAPAGYMKGFALAWAQVVGEFMKGDSSAINMARGNTHNENIDVLSWYHQEYEQLGMANEVDGIDTLRHLYALMLGLGMRESSGKYCCGRDMSASNVTSDTAEAGLFQTSYNAHSATSEFDKVMDAYEAGQRHGYLDYFDDNVTCSASNWANYGSGRGRQFQEMCKTQPAFAVETCALTLRNLRKHYGPINRKEAELKQEADWMLLNVQRYILGEDREAETEV